MIRNKKLRMEDYKMENTPKVEDLLAMVQVLKKENADLKAKSAKRQKWLIESDTLIKYMKSEFKGKTDKDLRGILSKAYYKLNKSTLQ